MYIYALNKFRKKKWENRVLGNKMRNKAELKKSIVKWLDEGKDQLLPLRDKLEKRRNQMDFMENEQTLGQHLLQCFVRSCLLDLEKDSEALMSGAL